MYIILHMTIAIILSVLALVLVFFKIPVWFSLFKTGEVSVKVSIFKLIRLTFPKREIKNNETETEVDEQQKEQEKKGKPKKKSKTARKLDWRLLFESLLDGSFIKRLSLAVVRFLKRLVFSFRLTINNGKIVYGAGDPAQTGIMMGRYYALRYSLPFSTEALVLETDFMKKRFDLEVHGRLTVHPGKILFALLMLLVEWPLWKTIRFVRKIRK